MKARWIAMYSGFIVNGDVDGYLHKKLTIAARDFGMSKFCFSNTAAVTLQNVFPDVVK